MSDPVARALGAVAVFGVLVNGALWLQLDRRVAKGQWARPVSEVQVRGERRDAQRDPARRRPGEAAPAPGQKGTPRRFDGLEAKIDAFGAERGLPADTVAAVREEMLLFDAARAAVREDVLEGRIPPREGRAEIRLLASDSEARVKALLGADLAAALRAALVESD